MIDGSLAMTAALAIIWLMLAGNGFLLLFFAKWRREWQLKRLQAEAADRWRVPMDRLGGFALVLVATAVVWSLGGMHLKL